MANCANIFSPADFGGSMSCAQLTTTLEELKTICSELNVLAAGTVYFHDQTPAAAPASPAAPTTIPGTLTAGVVVVEFWASATRYWKYNGSAWTLFFTRSFATSTGAPNRTAFSDNATGFFTWYGSLAPVFNEVIVGTYEVTLPAGTLIKSMEFTGGVGTLASSQLILKFIDTDGKSVFFSDPFLMNRSNWTRQDLGLTGINPKQDPSVAGTVTSTWVNMTLNSFSIFLNFM